MLNTPLGNFMKLFLSSYRIGTNPDVLANLISGKKRIAVIRNSLDFSNDTERLNRGRDREFDNLTALGLKPDEIDLRDYFKSPHRLQKDLDHFDATWVVGGNAFILRRAMRESSLDNILIHRLDDNEFTYAGYSAGACVVSLTLRGIDLVDFPNVIPEGYPPDVIWDGLRFVPFAIAPHFKSDHPDTDAIQESIDYFIDHKIPFVALRDGEAYVGEVKNQFPRPGKFA
jgi:dipeptidase E